MDGASGPTSLDCRECGTPLDPESNFCPECGASAPDEKLAAYCRTCGTEFEPDDRFCSNCGAVRNPAAEGVSDSPPRDEPSPPGAGPDPGPGPESRRRREDAGRPPRDDPGRPPGPGSGPPPDPREGTAPSDDQRAFRRRIQTYLANGWEIERDYGDSVVLVDRDYGNMAVHALLLFFTAGFGNLLYAWYRYSSSSTRVHLTADGSESDTMPERMKSDEGSLGAKVAGLLLMFFGLVGAAGNLADPGTVVFGLFLTLVGLYVFPATKRRIEGRHSPTKFGSVRSTDEQVVTSPDKPCVVCGRPIDRGIERSYREEKVAAGIPLYTTRSGENHYCEECAATDGDAGGGQFDHAEPATSTAEAEREPEYEFE